MEDQLKQLIKKIIPNSVIQYKINLAFNDSTDELVYIHIGKCGGSSLWKAINESPILRENFTKIHKAHKGKPPVLKRARYIFVIRNPIERSVSAFNWRFKLVVEDQVQRHRFKGEWEILKKLYR